MENMQLWQGRLSWCKSVVSLPAVLALFKLEGTGRLRNVIAKFATLEAAEACYRSADYQAALEYGKAASERDLIIVKTSE